MKRVAYAIFRITVKLLLKMLFGFKVNGSENIPSRGGVIVASNHQSFLDPPAIGSAISRQAHYMARDDLFSFPVWGSFLRFINVFSVRREGFDRRAIKAAVEFLRRGEVVILFPEGTRSLTGELLPPMPGIGMIAWEGRAVVVPAYIRGSGRAFPPKAKFIKFHKVEVTFGKPFEPQKLFSTLSSRREIYSGISLHIMSEIARLKEGARDSL